MDGLRVAPLVGILGCVGVLGTLAYPYAVSDVGVGAYYASGPVTPLAAGLLAAVGVIVFAAGREGRSDPSVAAGAGLVFGLFIVLISVVWAFTARVDVLGGAAASLSSQRWVLAAVAVLPLASAVWYARTLRLL